MRFDNHGYFHFYVVGDFWSKEIKNEEIMNQWCLLDVKIHMNDIKNKSS